MSGILFHSKLIHSRPGKHPFRPLCPLLFYLLSSYRAHDDDGIICLSKRTPWCCCMGRLQGLQLYNTCLLGGKWTPHDRNTQTSPHPSTRAHLTPPPQCHILPMFVKWSCSFDGERARSCSWHAALPRCRWFCERYSAVTTVSSSPRRVSSTTAKSMQTVG